MPNNWYYWRVKAYSATDSSEWSEVRSFSVATSTVGIPALVFPPADTVTNDSFPAFDWSDVAGATQYQMQVAKGTRWLWGVSSSNGIYVYNASDSSAINYIHQASLYNVNQVFLRDTLLFACSYNSVYITSVANPYTVTHLSTYTHNVNGATVRDTILYVATQNKGLRLVNIANPAAPAEISACDTTVTVNDVKVSGSRAYMISGGYLKVVDVSDPASPAILGTLPMSSAQEVEVAGGYVYTASGGLGLQVVDVSNPAAPVLQGSCYTSGNYQRLKVSGQYAYVAAYSGGLKVINLANPSNPVEFGSYTEADYAVDVALAGHYAYLADDYNGLAVIDITDPYNPVRDTLISMYYIDAVAVADTFSAIEEDTLLSLSSCDIDTFVGDMRHYWRARAGAGTWGSYSAVRRFTMDTQPPSETWNTAPSAGQLINDPTPVMDYNDVGDAYRYQIQIARDSAFAVMELDTLVYYGACTLLTPLSDGRLWWHVRAVDLAGNHALWSDSSYFRLDTQAPGAPAGITANGASPSLWTKTNSFSINFTPPFDSSGIYRYYYKKGTAPSSNYDTTGYGWDAAPPIDNITAVGAGVTPFYVWARDNAGNLDYNNQAKVDLRFDSIPPYGAVARANEFSRTTNFTASWNSGSDQGGSGLNGRYWIKMKVNGGSWTDLNTNYSGTSYLHTGVQGSKYYFEVAALDSAGNSEAFAGVPECSTLVDNTITSPILVSPYNGAIRDSASNLFLWQRAAAQAGSRLQCSYNSSFSALAKDTVLAADSSGTLALSDSLYYWRVRGENSPTDTSGWSPARTLRIDTQAPEVPFLSEPAPDTLCNDNTPLFVWKEAAGAAWYRLTVSPDSTFATVTVDEVIDTTAYNIQVTLPDSDYHWKVRAGDAAGNWSVPSEKWKFTVDTKAPAVPVAVAPSDNASLTTNLPQFIWRASAQATQYRLQVANNTSFSPVETDTSLSDTSAVPVWGVNDGTHYWRVRCRDLAGNWSAYSNYRTLSISGLLQVALITPDTGALWAPSQSVWIQFTKPLYTGYIDTTHIKVRGKHTSIVRSTFTWQAASRTLMVAPDSAFAANDTITVFLHGTLRDSANISTLDGNNSGTATGDSTDSYQMTFRTSFIGDYNSDGLLNGPDLVLFTWGWYNYSRYFEAGPYFGTWPHQRVYVGGATKLSFDDLCGFIYSWNMSGGAKYEPAKQADPGPLTLEYSPKDPGQMIVKIQPGAEFRGLDASIEFDQAAGTGTVTASDLWISEGNPQLFLTRQVPGRIEISAAAWPGGSRTTDELFRFSLNGAKTQTPVSLNYRLCGAGGELVAEGSLATALDILPGLPAAFSFSPARPNPAGHSTVICYQLPSETQVKLEVYNIAGQKVATLAEGNQPAGYYSKTWNLMDSQGRKVANGVYLFKLQAGENRGIGKMVVIR